MNIRYRCLSGGLGEEIIMDIDPNRKIWTCPKCGALSCLLSIQDINRFLLLLNDLLDLGSIFFESGHNFILMDELGNFLPDEIARNLLLLEMWPLSLLDGLYEPIPGEFMDSPFLTREMI